MRLLCSLPLLSVCSVCVQWCVSSMVCCALLLAVASHSKPPRQILTQLNGHCPHLQLHPALCTPIVRAVFAQAGQLRAAVHGRHHVRFVNSGARGVEAQVQERAAACVMA